MRTTTTTTAEQLSDAAFARGLQTSRTRTRTTTTVEEQMLGDDELPGPQPGMVVQEVEAAQLSDGEAEEGGSDAGEEAAGWGREEAAGWLSVPDCSAR